MSPDLRDALHAATSALTLIREDAQRDAMLIDGKPTTRMGEDLGNLYASVHALASIVAVLVRVETERTAPNAYPQTRPWHELASDDDDARRDARREAMRDGL